MSLKEAMKTKKKDKIQEALKKAFVGKLVQAVNEQKTEIANNILTEAADDDEQSEVPQKNHEVKIIRSKSGDTYRYQFAFNNRVYVVEFKPLEGSNSFVSHFYAKGFKDDEKMASRFGISSVNQIEKVFANIIRAIEMFLEIRKPQAVKFIAGEGAKFPSVFHQYIYNELENASKRLKGHFTIYRGSATHDGSAFTIKKGGAASILRSKSWKPGEEPAKEEPVEEEIANVSGPAVSVDRPTKSGLGFPGLAKETQKQTTAIERRKPVK